MADKTYINGEGSKLVILLTMKEEAQLAETVFHLITEALPESDFTLAVYESSDWNGDFSPWKYDMQNGRFFAGNGKTTLEKVKQTADKKYTDIYIAGYSLAGLFALWSLRETDLFDGCACCSGSLWFDGWEEYRNTHPLKKSVTVYLSLGGKEDKVNDAVISTIGEKTRKEDRGLEEDTCVIKHTLVMNSGGHFASPDKRLAKGIIWLLQGR